MSFPLDSMLGGEGSPPSEKVYKRQPKKAAKPAAPVASPLRTPLWLVAGGLLWCLVVLALLTHDRADSAFSIAGNRALYANRVGALGAWVSDLLLFGFGYSCWWFVLVALRAWLGSLAGLLRVEAPQVLPPEQRLRSRGLWWLGLLLLIAASCTLEWSRLYGWEARLPGHAGGVLGYTLGPLSMKALGFAGSGVLAIAALLTGISLALEFSWLRLAELIGTRIDEL